MQILNSFLLFLLVLVQGFDMYSTIIILKKGGRELNPIMNFLTEHFGIVPSVFLSHFWFVICGTIALSLFATSLILTIALIVLLVLNVIIAVNNKKVLRIYK